METTNALETTVAGELSRDILPPQKKKHTVRSAAHRFGAKLTAVVLFTLSAFIGALSLFATAFAASDQLGTHSEDPFKSAIVSSGIEAMNDIALRAYRGVYTGETLETADALDPSYTNYRYTIVDETGAVLASNAEGTNAKACGWEFRNFFDDGTQINVFGFLSPDLAAHDDLRARVMLANFLYQNKTLLLVLGVIGLLVAVTAFVFLMFAAGRHSDSDEPRRTFIDRIPFDLLLLISIGVVVLAILPLTAINTPELWMLMVIVESVLLIVNLLWFVLMTMTFATRIKTRTFWRNNVCVMVVLFFVRMVKAVFRWIGLVLGNLPLLWKGIVGFIALGLLLLVLGSSDGVGQLLFVMLTGVLFVGMTLCILQLKRIERGGEALARGDLSGKIDTKGMPRTLKRHAENLNSIAEGMSKAVDARLKSERMKTDLITNVSHDLKTPLTSIINYVDLLKKEDVHNETAAGYVEVLDRQAARLKKLTEDIVEASKAASGSITPHFAPADLCELARQGLAEYSDRFAAASLLPVLTAPETPVNARCDGRLMWRVFDNLFNNVLKYALSGTRVYVDVSAQAGRAVATVKNVSRDALNIPAEELTERFVRGDASRASDGSGLGLSIAQSLTELQGGGFAISISGDLFTAAVELPLL